MWKIVSCLLLLFCVTAMADDLRSANQRSLSPERPVLAWGRIVWADSNKPVVGAIVWIGNAGAKTNTNGAYSLSGVPARQNVAIVIEYHDKRCQIVPTLVEGATTYSGHGRDFRVRLSPKKQKTVSQAQPKR